MSEKSHETEKQETKDLYKAESLVAQEGNGRQIISGTIIS